MAIFVVDQAANQSLVEYTVGRATSSCVFPGIAQCFAIAGWTQTGMLCTHVSPGASKQDITDTFGALRDMGGGDVLAWYVIGPFARHFAVNKARWHSAGDIKSTFKSEFGNRAANHFVVDATPERETRVVDPGFTIARMFNGIDVRAEHRGYDQMIVFSYKESSRRASTWTRFALNRFILF